MAERVTVKFEITERGGRPGASRPGDREGAVAESLDDLLSDPHARHIVEYLRERGEPVDVEGLAAHVVARVRDVPVESIGADVRRRVGTWLHHGQLPALSDHGVVEYDAETGTVRLLERR